MKEKRLSNDSIIAYFDRIDEKFADVMNKLGEIHEQTSKTNGRVTSLESWKNTSQGAITILSVFVVPVMLYLLYTHLK